MSLGSINVGVAIRTGEMDPRHRYLVQGDQAMFHICLNNWVKKQNMTNVNVFIATDSESAKKRSFRNIEY